MHSRVQVHHELRSDSFNGLPKEKRLDLWVRLLMKFILNVIAHYVMFESCVLWTFVVFSNYYCFGCLMLILESNSGGITGGEGEMKQGPSAGFKAGHCGSTGDQ